MSEKPKSIIDSTTPSIVIQETPISLSDEKLKNILLQTYEAATKDANKSKFYKYYDVLLSVSLTLLIPLLTSDFKPIWTITADIMKSIAWVICTLCGIAGIVFMLIASNQSMKNDTEKRDKTINRIFSDHFLTK